MLISPNPCRSCGAGFEITESAMRKGNYICTNCRKVESRNSYLSRKARGMDVSGAKMPREWHAAYEASYKHMDYVKKARCDQFKNRMLDPVEFHKAKVREHTRKAIRVGILQRMPCYICGEARSHAHHEDYDKPLDVIWVCAKHHSDIHKKARGEK